MKILLTVAFKDQNRVLGEVCQYIKYTKILVLVVVLTT